MPFDVAARIVRHERLNPDHFLLTLLSPSIARAARAGQFVMLQVREGSQPLLRRPMSICRVVGGRAGRFEILYKVVGEGTRFLSTRPPGALLRTLGPLGNGFRLKRSRTTRPILVSGGIGVAIFPFLVESLSRLRRRPTLLYGARSRRDLVALDFFRRRRIPFKLATEDGSAGTKGFVTRLLEPLLAAGTEADRYELFVCGPTPMMRAVRELAARYEVPSQLALEAHMPCGIGVCLGCVVRCSDSGTGAVFRRVCTEGPVFEAREVVL